MHSSPIESDQQKTAWKFSALSLLRNSPKIYAYDDRAAGQQLQHIHFLSTDYTSSRNIKIIDKPLIHHFAYSFCSKFVPLFFFAKLI